MELPDPQQHISQQRRWGSLCSPTTYEIIPKWDGFILLLDKEKGGDAMSIATISSSSLNRYISSAKKDILDLLSQTLFNCIQP
jgi:hypothetical protein